MNRDKLFLVDIQEAITRIETVAEHGHEAFLADFTKSDAIIKNFMVIGEAAKNLSTEIKAKQPQVPWKKIVGFRNILIHHYFGTDLEEVWRVIQKELPEFHKAINFLLPEND